MEKEKLASEVVNEDNVVFVEEGLPKTFTFTIGINGEPKLNIGCDSEYSLKDVATALATIDLLLFNQQVKTNEDGMNQYIMFNTLRKEIFLEAVQRLCGEDNDTSIIETLADML